MPDILIRGMEMPTGCASCDFAIYKADSAYHYCFWLKQVFVKPDARLKSCPLHELPPHGELIETKDVLLALVEHGQRDKRFKLGDTIRYSPSEVKEIIDASVPVVVPAERKKEDG